MKEKAMNLKENGRVYRKFLEQGKGRKKCCNYIIISIIKMFKNL